MIMKKIDLFNDFILNYMLKNISEIYDFNEIFGHL